MKDKLKRTICTFLVVMLGIGVMPCSLLNDFGVAIEAEAAYHFQKPARFGRDADISSITLEMADDNYVTLLNLGDFIFDENEGMLDAVFTFSDLNTDFPIAIYFCVENLSTGEYREGNNNADNSYVQIESELPVKVSGNELVDSLSLYVEIAIIDGGNPMRVAYHYEEIEGSGCSDVVPGVSVPSDEMKGEKEAEKIEESQTPETHYGVFQESVMGMVDEAMAQAVKNSEMGMTAESSGLIRIDTGVWISLKGNVYRKMQDSGLPVEITFIYKGERYRVNIPAGADLMSLVDENGYCGFLNLMAHFGGTKL